jgi:hypothetical protein
VLAHEPAALRGFLERLLGWTGDRAAAVDLALRSVELAASHKAALVLSGACDLVPVAQALHRRILGVDRAFAIADPRRREVRASVRGPASYGTAARALAAVRGGSLCVRCGYLPHDLASIAAQLRHADVMLMVCTTKCDEANPLLIRPAPVHLPPLAVRATELSRIIDEYALDAIAALDAAQSGFTKRDHEWVREHAAGSLVDIEKATMRLVAVRQMGSRSAAAERVGMAPVSLIKWFERRRPHRSRR